MYEVHRNFRTIYPGGCSMHSSKTFGILFIAVVTIFAALKDDSVEITEWQVPWEGTRPRDPYVDGQGRVWFVGQQGNYIAYLDPEKGTFKRYEIEEGTYPHNLIVDTQGSVWYAGNRNARIGRLDPKNGTVKTFPMPDSEARDPHTLVLDRDGDIWFTAQGGNVIGKLMTKTGKVHIIKVPTSRARPYGIKIDSKGRPWIVLFGTNKIATIDPETMELEEIDLPRPDTRPRRIEIDSNDILWYVDYSKGYLGRLDPKTRKVREWAAPGGESSRPYGTALDDKDRIWFVESGLDPNRLVGFDQKTEKFFSKTVIESGGGTVRHMYFHSPTREIWFGTDTNYIGRARIP